MWMNEMDDWYEWGRGNDEMNEIRWMDEMNELQWMNGIMKDWNAWIKWMNGWNI